MEPQLRTLSTEQQLTAVKQKLGAVDTELEQADERLTRALSTSSAQSTADLPPLASGGRPPASPPLARRTVLGKASALCRAPHGAPLQVP